MALWMQVHTRSCFSWGSVASLHADQWHYRLYGPPGYGRMEGWQESLETRTNQLGIERTNPGLLGDSCCSFAFAFPP